MLRREVARFQSVTNFWVCSSDMFLWLFVQLQYWTCEAIIHCWCLLEQYNFMLFLSFLESRSALAIVYYVGIMDNNFKIWVVFRGFWVRWTPKWYWYNVEYQLIEWPLKMLEYTFSKYIHVFTKDIDMQKDCVLLTALGVLYFFQALQVLCNARCM